MSSDRFYKQILSRRFKHRFFFKEEFSDYKLFPPIFREKINIKLVVEFKEKNGNLYRAGTCTVPPVVGERKTSSQAREKHAWVSRKKVIA